MTTSQTEPQQAKPNNRRLVEHRRIVRRLKRLIVNQIGGYEQRARGYDDRAFRRRRRTRPQSHQA